MEPRFHCVKHSCIQGIERYCKYNKTKREAIDYSLCLSSFIIYKKTIIFFNSKISPTSNCVGYYHPILLTRKMTCPNSYGWLAVSAWIWFLMASLLPCHCLPHFFVLNTERLFFNGLDRVISIKLKNIHLSSYDHLHLEQ